MGEYQSLCTSSAKRAQGTQLKRSCPGFINPHQLIDIPLPIILDIPSETAPLGPREAESYSGQRHALRDLHRHDPNGNEDDQPRWIGRQIRGWRWQRGDGSSTRCVTVVAMAFTRRARSCDFRGCLVTLF